MKENFTHQWCPSWSKSGLGGGAIEEDPAPSKWCSKVEKQKAAWEGEASGPPRSRSASSSSASRLTGRSEMTFSMLRGIASLSFSLSFFSLLSLSSLSRHKRVTVFVRPSRKETRKGRRERESARKRALDKSTDELLSTLDGEEK